jgi:hypothetical protein
VHRRQMSPLRAVELPSGTQLDGAERGMTWCRRRVGQVQRPDAGQAAIALLLLLLLLVLCYMRDVGGDRRQVEGLGLVLRIGGRRLALLLLLHDADYTTTFASLREPYKRRRNALE